MIVDMIDPMVDYYISRVVSLVSEEIIRRDNIDELGSARQLLCTESEIYCKQRCFEGDYILDNFSYSPYKRYRVYDMVPNPGLVESRLLKGRFGCLLRKQLENYDCELRHVCERLIQDMEEDRPKCNTNTYRPGTKVFYSPFNIQELKRYAPKITGHDVSIGEGTYPCVYGFITHFARQPGHLYPCILIASYTYYWPWDLERGDGKADYEPVSLLWQIESSKDMSLRYIAARSHWYPILYKPKETIKDPKNVSIHFSKKGHTPIPFPPSNYELVRYSDLNKDFIDKLGKVFGLVWAKLQRRTFSFSKILDIFRIQSQTTTPSVSDDYEIKWGWIPHNVELNHLTDKKTIPFQAFVDMVANYQIREQGVSYTKYVADSMNIQLNTLGIISLTTSLSLNLLRDYSLYF
jgi:hypothetical protein